MDKPYKLLIIDDNEETLTMLHAFFSKKNYEVASSLSGLEGLKLFESDKKGFDLVITDLVMPNISGVAVISIIKKKKSRYTCHCNNRMGGTSRIPGFRSKCRSNTLKTFAV